MSIAVRATPLTATRRLLRLLSQSATVTHFAQEAATDAEGNWVPTTPTTATYPVRVEESEGRMFFPPDAVVHPHASIVVDGKRYEALDAVLHSSPGSGHHVQVEIQRVSNTE